MSVMVYEVYDAFIAAGAPEDKARGAASAVLGGNEIATKSDMRCTLSDIQCELKDFELRMTLRVGGMIASAVVIIGVMIKLL